MYTNDTIFKDFWMITHVHGSTLGKLDLGEDFCIKDVEIRTKLVTKIKIVLFCRTSWNQYIYMCLYCGVDQPFTSEDHYPQCEVLYICSSREPVKTE